MTISANKKRMRAKSPTWPSGRFCCPLCGHVLHPLRRAYTLRIHEAPPPAWSSKPRRYRVEYLCSQRCFWRARKRLQRGSVGPFLAPRELNRRYFALYRHRISKRGAVKAAFKPCE